MKKVILVTGANRGIGYESCRQLAGLGHEVILGARSAEKGEAAVAKLKGLGLKVSLCALDVAEDASVKKAVEFVRAGWGRLDVLANNAGIFVETQPGSPGEIDGIRKSLETNTYGPLRMARAFAPLLAKSSGGRIVNVSSGMGQLGEMNGGYMAYRLSKTALNAVTRVLAEELAPVAVNSMCPGWVKTDMGGAGAELSVDQGADTLVWLATEADTGISGKFFRERREIPW